MFHIKYKIAEDNRATVEKNSQNFHEKNCLSQVPLIETQALHVFLSRSLPSRGTATHLCKYFV